MVRGAVVRADARRGRRDGPADIPIDCTDLDLDLDDSVPDNGATVAAGAAVSTTSDGPTPYGDGLSFATGTVPAALVVQWPPPTDLSGRRSTYPASSLGASTTTSMTAEGSLVTDADTITVMMTLTSNTADSNVTPGTLSISGMNGAGATCAAAGPPAQDILADTPITIVWSCTANAGATPGSITFSGNAAGDASSFAIATSNSVLVSPLLTFQVTVDDPLDRNVGTIVNTAEMTSDQQPDPNRSTVVDAVDTGAIIGDSVWLDTDGDGIQDIGEAGLSNVLVELYADPDGVPGNGDESPGGDHDDRCLRQICLSPDLSPGSGKLLRGRRREHPARGSGGLAGQQQRHQRPHHGHRRGGVPGCRLRLSVAGGPGGSRVIGDYLWSDADGDGIQDPGEPGIGNVTVELLGPGPDGILGTADDVAVATTTTTPDGRFFFTGVTPGQYQVAVTDTGGVLGGYTPTSGPQSEGGYVSNPVTVASGGVISDVDFGFDNNSLFSISDRVWLDSDGDGIADGTEAGAPGVTVNLLSDPDGIPGNGDEIVIATAITAANGDFSFDGVAAAEDYVIEITDTADVLRGGGGTTAAAQDGILAIPNLSGDVSGTNFGYNALSALFGTLWNDADGDGIQNPAEIGLGGVTVELQDGTCTPAVDCLITLTGADGFYFFRGLEPNLYTVVVTDTTGALTGYTQTGDPDEPGTCSICDAMSTTVVDLSTGEQYLDFGYQNDSLDDISGTIFDDVDTDGVEDPGESGLAGVTLALLDDAGNEIATTTTDTNGDYVFPDLPSGGYSVRVTDQTGALEGYRLTSGLDELSAQPGDGDVDFGYTRSPGTAAIGDRVWLDADGDGQAGPNEAGLAGVVVDLWEDTDGDGVLNPVNDTLITSTVTDANGDYVFADLAAGNYFVDVDESTLPVTSPGDLVETTYPAGVNPSAVIALSATERFAGADFGYLPASGTAVLGDRVWYDADGNGLQDAGEIGIGGVDITIVGPGCSSCTVTTDSDGSWLATGLAPGDYMVTYDYATLPTGYNTIPTNLGGDDTYTLIVAADDVMCQLDFGFDSAVPPARSAMASGGTRTAMELRILASRELMA